jgi:ribosomal protein S27AE
VAGAGHAAKERPVPCDDPSARWLAVAEEALVGMRDWRAAHPRATWAEIEAEYDARLARLKGQVLHDAAQASPAADFRRAGAAERPPCPRCGAPLRAAGQAPRTLATGGTEVVVERTYGRCPRCGAGLFPPR